MLGAEHQRGLQVREHRQGGALHGDGQALPAQGQAHHEGREGVEEGHLRE